MMNQPNHEQPKRSRCEKPLIHQLLDRAITSIFATAYPSITSAMAFLFLLRRWPLLVYATTWTALISATVALAVFSPEVAFVWALSPASSLRSCGAASVRLPMDGSPSEVVCVPAYLFDRSAVDAVIPPLFAVAVLAASVSVMRAVGLWEDEEEEEEAIR